MNDIRRPASPVLCGTKSKLPVPLSLLASTFKLPYANHIFLSYRYAECGVWPTTFVVGQPVKNERYIRF